MAIVNMSVDTKTRGVAVTVDGIIVPAVACHLDKFIDMDGQVHISLAYTVEVDSGNGLLERRTFFMPQPDIEETLGENGLACRIEPNENEFAEHLSKYLQGDETKEIND